ncbi:uncharacterized protein LTR77_004315 [Saxophila tyrrhenica]|uniref:Uncharacterized protein n=1 Tax=Saxophila tyrrhenica TaxID=1690608 RepID=A0AAV9PD94_9PEZI|nr:hypothetical protein LTR77_004315 [Saxophila tyrrhenica]
MAAAQTAKTSVVHTEQAAWAEIAQAWHPCFHEAGRSPFRGRLLETDVGGSQQLEQHGGTANEDEERRRDALGVLSRKATMTYLSESNVGWNTLSSP